MPEGAPAPIIVARFYRFAPLAALPQLRARILHHARGEALRGTILLAEEGINGTVSGPRGAIDRLFDGLRREPALGDLEVRESTHDGHPFGRFRVRIKREIVSLGQPGIDPRRRTGEHVPPAQWNALLRRSDLKVLDTRNRYEVHLGTFEGAIDPGTASFRDFPGWVAENLDPARDREIAMFCTGGIRCEKAAAHLLEQGFERVYQLDGGILAYLEYLGSDDASQRGSEASPEANHWRGECFVFDERVTVDRTLRAVPRELCPNCRLPILPGEKELPEYEPDVSCRHCFERTDERRRASLAERQRQATLARAREAGSES